MAEDNQTRSEFMDALRPQAIASRESRVWMNIIYIPEVGPGDITVPMLLNARRELTNATQKRS